MPKNRSTEHVATAESGPTGQVGVVARRCGNATLAGAVVTTAFLLACYKLTDTDIWWHLRAGEWMLAHASVPGLDPFTFGSADRAWIDLHWLFEVISTAMFRLAGIPGVTLLGAATAACAVLVSLWVRPRRPGLLAAGCWIVPMVLLGYRLDPRPELFSLLFLAVFVGVLDIARRRPTAVWALPAVQVLWVNMHGLFVLGPVIYFLFLLGETAGRFIDKGDRGQPASSPAGWHHATAFVAVLACCLVNPYGVKGALLPLELFPKIADPANDYKTYIDEFFGPLEYARRSQAFVRSHAIYYRSLYLLWIGLPLSFVLPSLARMVRDSAAAMRGRQAGDASLRRADRGFRLAVATAVFGLICGALTVLPPAGESWPKHLDQGLLAAVGLGWLLSANDLRRVSFRASLLAPLAGLGQLMTSGLLQTAFAGSLASKGQTSGFLLLALGCWAAAAVLTLRAGGDLYRMLLAAAFAYLSFQAVRNLNVFALVAGMVLAGNMDELGDDGALQRGARWAGPAGWIAAGALAALFAIWMGVICTGRWNQWTNSTRQVGLGEPAGEFAHDAARFAGSDGLPQRAIAFDLGMAALYVFHNGPDKKVYLDPRLEVPTLETFKSYVAIDDSLHGRGDAWRAALQQLGEPLVLLDHRGHTTGEALLLTDGPWRCIYYDALGSVFVSSRSSVSTRQYPTVDFALRHFARRPPETSEGSPSAGDDSLRTEAEALTRLASELCRWPSATWSWRIPAQWLALDRLAQMKATQANEQDVWALRGRCYWNLVSSFATPPPRPGEAWHNAAGIRWAQSTWCLQRALRLDPRHAISLRTLYDTWRARRMPEAQMTAGRELVGLGGLGSRQAQEMEELERRLASLAKLNLDSARVAQQTVRELVEGGLGVTAAEWVERSGATTRDWEWQLVDQLAATCMHLGRPETARSLWQESDWAPSQAGRLSRLADTWWVEGDFARAERGYREAIEAEPAHADSHWALAVLEADRGAVAEARRACLEALECDLPDPQREELRAVLNIVERCDDREHARQP